MRGSSVLELEAVKKSQYVFGGFVPLIGKYVVGEMRCGTAYIL